MNRSIYLNIFFLLALTIISCQTKLKDEDLIIRYIQENSEKFEDKNDFYILTLRFAPLECYAQIFGYDAEQTVRKVADSLNTDNLFVLYDNDFSYIKVDEVVVGKNVKYVKETFSTLDAYAFPFTPHVFHIKNNKIKKWNKAIYKYASNTQ